MAMASSKLVRTNPDLPRESSLCSLSTLLSDPSKNITMDDLLRSIYSSEPIPNPNPNPEPSTPPPPPPPPAAPPRQGSFSLPKDMAAKTVDEVWKEIVAGTHSSHSSHSQEMTLEDFLTKAGAVRHDDLPPPHFPIEEPSSLDPFPNGIDSTVTVVGVPQPPPPQPPPGGRGKRRAVQEPVDKATLQKQRRMIKNRESAARSRERKQAYTVELESMVTQLEEENARLLKEEADQNKQRLKQLMECLIPVVEKRKPRRMLRRVNSVQW